MKERRYIKDHVGKANEGVGVGVNCDSCSKLPLGIGVVSLSDPAIISLLPGKWAKLEGVADNDLDIAWASGVRSAK